MRAGGRFSGGRRAESRLSRSRFSGSGASFILDRFPGAAAAYSLRQLSKSTTHVVRVRRDSDNDETDFTAEQINSATLLDFTGTGVSAAGYVPLWYDQSGNSRDAPQATASSQPKIVDGGVLVTANGKAALAFDGVDDGFDISTTMANQVASAPRKVIALVSRYTGTQTPTRIRTLFFGSGGATRVSFFVDGTDFVGTFGGFVDSVAITFDFSQNFLAFGQDLDGEQSFFLNSGTSGSNSLGDVIDDIDNAKIGFAETQRDYHTGTISEIILYPSDQSANRTDIEANIADYYGITLA